MKRAIILQGISGSGKSTFARNIAGKLRSGYENVVIVSADDFFTTRSGYSFSPAKLSQAHAECFRKFLEALRENFVSVIVDNTNTSQVEIAPYVLGARAFHVADLEMVCLRVCPEKAKQRNVHNTLHEAVDRQFDRLRACHETWPKHWPEIQFVDK